MKIGMVGLGRMGRGLAERLRRHGHQVVGFDVDPAVSEVGSLAELVRALDGEPRRIVWVMVPAGAPTDETVRALAELLGEGDLVVDGGNTNVHDSLRHQALLRDRGTAYVDAGVSGGVWGLEEGFCLMVGGADEDVRDLEPIARALATAGGFAHVGPAGAGHFTKMVHNGVEYALMEAYAEGYELLGAADLPIDVPAALEVWRHGSVVRSWLLDLLSDALAKDPDLEQVRGYVDDSGEGRWTVQEAIDRAVPTPAIAAALFARFASRQDDAPAMKALAVLRNAFGGHAIHPEVAR